MFILFCYMRWPFRTSVILALYKYLSVIICHFTKIYLIILPSMRTGELGWLLSRLIFLKKLLLTVGITVIFSHEYAINICLIYWQIIKILPALLHKGFKFQTFIFSFCRMFGTLSWNQTVCVNFYSKQRCIHNISP